MKKSSSSLGILALLVALLMAPVIANAVPSYARQMNVSCTACHTEFPILTDMGRAFKLGGYSMSVEQTMAPPLAVMLQPSFTNTNSGQQGAPAPLFRNNGNTAMDQMSVFYAGRLFGPYAKSLFGDKAGGFLNKFGTFIQTTFDGVHRVLHWDNSEIRYADHGTLVGQSVAYGFYANNNPGMQDPWHTMPAWGFPFSGSVLAPTPSATTMLSGTFAQQVIGMGGYIMLSDSLYLDVAAYHTPGAAFQRNMGIHPATQSQISGLAPYWRAAYTKKFGNQSLEFGMFGMAASTYPGRDSSAGKDHTVDWGLDSQYQASFGRNDVLGVLTYTRESQQWNASQALGNTSNNRDSLWSLRGAFDYLFDKTYGGAVGYFLINGSSDPLLYSNSANGSPLSDGFILQLNWMPLNKNGGPGFWPKSNAKISLQYVIYNRFNGAQRNYDGAGRNASDNNTLYLQAWLAF